MRARLAVVGAAAAGTLVLGAAGAVAIPALAADTTPAPSPEATADGPDRTAKRAEAITQALAGLVRAGTISQAQADAVAAELAGSQALRGPGGRHGGPGRGLLGGEEVAAAAAGALGLQADALRDRLRAGETLKAIAEAQGKDLDAVVAAVVAAVEKRIAAEVTAGRLTQARADEIRSRLAERVRALAEQGRPARPDGGRGWGHRGGDTDRDGDSDRDGNAPTPTPSASATPTT